MAPYHILIVTISSVIPEHLVLLTRSEPSGPKSAHIRPTTYVSAGFTKVSGLAIAAFDLVYCSLSVLRFVFALDNSK